MGEKIKRDDYVINPDFFTQFPTSNDENRVSFTPPEILILPIQILLAPSWNAKFGGFMLFVVFDY